MRHRRHEQTVWRSTVNNVYERRHAVATVCKCESSDVPIIFSPSGKMEKNYKCNNSFSCLLPPTRRRWCLWRHSNTCGAIRKIFRTFGGSQTKFSYCQQRQERPPGGSLFLPTLNQMWNSGLCQTLIPSPCSLEKMIALKYENICVSEEDEMVRV